MKYFKNKKDFLQKKLINFEKRIALLYEKKKKLKGQFTYQEIMRCNL